MSTRIPGAAAAMRKAPRQARSRAMVDAIVEAGARVLDARGWAGFTTNEVAGVAGVSIGSLYQYFPDKTALVDAIRRRHFDAVLETLRLVAGGEAGPEALVDGMIAIHRDYPALHRVLLELPDPYAGEADRKAFQDRYLRLYGAIVERHRGPDDGDGVAAHTLSSAMEGVIHHAARRGLLAAPGLRRELLALVCAYLGGAAPAAGPGPA
ncbi:TetR family transcriptional regulator [Chromobacterium sp. ATCC 53434]|uniref:TetR/AcrR family transcriptional regulator n=1 Tax=Chromobacterium TaxID=535 RepID=UPI000C77FFDD|nr:TetR/AcrR family transcriptional regulator [Chromobacterium sp. ATCC 53434]AUH53751.1 TetR family transcriptional regulator [Chromobacterium sp. ATCC 53434]